MPDKCKDLFLMSMGERPMTKRKELSFEELKFAVQDRELEDFRIGLRVPGKLVPRRIPGGVLLVEDYFTMR